MKAHLSDCTKYLRKCQLGQVTNQYTEKAAVTVSNSRTKSILPVMSAEKKAALDTKFALACYAEGRPFNIYSSRYTKDALHSLNPSYTPPHRKAIAGHLLDKVYDKIKYQVQVLIDSQPFINIITDESSNINDARVSNISLLGEFGSVHYTSEDIGDLRMNAKGCGTWIRNHLLVLSKNDLEWINSIATDTSPVMFATWTYLKIN